MSPSFTISGHIVDVVQKRIYPGQVHVENGKIAALTPLDRVDSQNFILPGFIDAHIHIESSMLIPSEFARLATLHGTVATVSDPHEIANVLGLKGVRYMLQNGKQVPFHFYFGAPSCVPATEFETAGAKLDANDIHMLFEEDKLHYLSEMMNFPGVLHQDPQVMQKIAIAKQFNKPIDGHAPGLMGQEAARYISAGIFTDHECFTLEEALNKLKHGMKILIREGSAAKNYEALHSLIQTHPNQVMFCSDDKHPHELVNGHIDQIVKRSIAHGYDVMDVLRCACYNPVEHYQLTHGLLQQGDSADFIVVNNLHDFYVKATYIQGRLVAKEGKSLIERTPASIINYFNCQPKKVADFALKEQAGSLQVIQAMDGQLITKKIIMEGCRENGFFVSDPERDLLKIAVINRYQEAPIALGFIQGFGLKDGALASCIAHDSHNIVCVGVTDEAMCAAVNAIVASQGGIAVATNNKIEALALPIGGIMSHDEGYKVAADYVKIDHLAKQLGSTLQAPFMTLSFMALLVIPSLKLSDKGLFDGEAFVFAPLVV
jgi:adenine deaminase